MKNDKLTHKVFYFDKNENIVSKDNAEFAIIRTEDENGNLVHEEFQTFKSEEEIKKMYDNINLTNEDREMLEKYRVKK